ncbi:MAG: hypothetical protein HY959_09440 [Ignavibacteriae bacterium]|nr:hypothetical protein [Ignavibacteriota bacterium]
MLKKLILVFAVTVFAGTSVGQVKSSEEFSKKQILSDKILKTGYRDSVNTERITGNKKNPTISVFLSLLVPGAGHLYADRMDVGKYFVASEAACWLGVAGLSLYGNWLRDDSRTFAAQHSGLNEDGKDDDYFGNVGNFESIYTYNNEKLAKGQWDKIYDVNTHFWNWDNDANRNQFDLQRKKSERTYNTRIVFATGLIVNRLISAISAVILTNKGNKNTSSGIRINSEFIGTKENPYDGLRLNFVKSF